jgi:asparagine synthase (glutamine-hydrolysing)
VRHRRHRRHLRPARRAVPGGPPAHGGRLRHRGPDEFGLYRDARAGLAHARLSIVDLSTGQQPLANEDETLWVVFNGEIFNYVELREELLALGHHFRTRSDTEVIVHAYEAWGEQAFARFNGQWAVALWDTQQQRLVLARDRLGVRPLYLCEHAGAIYSRAKSRRSSPPLRRSAERSTPRGLEQTFTFWSVVPPQSVFEGIEELRPGYVRVYEHGQMREQRIWESSYPLGPEATGQFQGTLDDAVAR